MAGHPDHLGLAGIPDQVAQEDTAVPLDHEDRKEDDLGLGDLEDQVDRASGAYCLPEAAFLDAGAAFHLDQAGQEDAAEDQDQEYRPCVVEDLDEVVVRLDLEQGRVAEYGQAGGQSASGCQTFPRP